MATVLIPLTQGKFATIDAEDEALVSGYHWWATRQGKRWYARARASRGEGGRRLALHRLILGAPAGMAVDHINGDGLDCRRSNLRLATTGQNCFNRAATCMNTIGYKGVFLVKRGGSPRWRAKIQFESKAYALGTFSTPEEAARAYDAKAREFFGEFAWTNFKEVAG